MNEPRSKTDRLALFAATGFGTGYSPFASGTAGSLPGVPLTWGLWILCGGLWMWQAAACLVLIVLAIPICGRAEKIFGKKDDGRIVADEYMTFPICLIGLPADPSHWKLLCVAFAAARFFDIVKPPPARGLQRLKGGLGIVIDDVIASLYALAAVHAAVWMAPSLLQP